MILSPAAIRERWRTEHFQSPQAGGGSGLDAELVENLEDMFFDGGFAVTQDGRDLTVGFTLGNPQESLGNPGSQVERFFQRSGRMEVRFEFRYRLLDGSFETRTNGGQQIGLGDRLRSSLHGREFSSGRATASAHQWVIDAFYNSVFKPFSQR
jgi:hypothetical protein